MIAVGVVCGLMVGWFACSMCAQAKIGDLMAAVRALKEWNADLVAVITTLKQPRSESGRFMKREAR